MELEVANPLRHAWSNLQSLAEKAEAVECIFSTSTYDGRRARQAHRNIVLPICKWMTLCLREYTDEQGLQAASRTFGAFVEILSAPNMTRMSLDLISPYCDHLLYLIDLMASGAVPLLQVIDGDSDIRAAFKGNSATSTGWTGTVEAKRKVAFEKQCRKRRIDITDLRFA